MHTIVQHSGFGYGDDDTFERGLETREVPDKEVPLIRAAGGLLFDTWEAADDYTERESYPPGADGLIPAAPGTFSDVAVDGLRLYLPPRPTVRPGEDGPNGTPAAALRLAARLIEQDEIGDVQRVTDLASALYGLYGQGGVFDLALLRGYDWTRCGPCESESPVHPDGPTCLVCGSPVERASVRA